MKENLYSGANISDDSDKTAPSTTRAETSHFVGLLSILSMARLEFEPSALYEFPSDILFGRTPKMQFLPFARAAGSGTTRLDRFSFVESDSRESGRVAL